MLDRLTRRGLMAVGVLALGFAATPAEAAVEVGKAAPDFTGLTVEGEEISLSDYRGKTVVLEWTNHQCPFVQKHYDSQNMQGVQASAAEDDVVWISVVSSRPGAQGYVEAAEAKEIIADTGAVVAEKVLDPEGTIGRLYNARRTPEMYVIDGDGVLRYMGAIDSKASARISDIETADNYVRMALAAVAAGQSPDPAVTTAYGCTVKY